MSLRRAFLVSFLFLGLTLNAQTQSKRQQELEAQRIRLKNEIKQINTLLFSNTKKRKDVLTEVEDLTVKLNVREALIKVTNDQANLLTRQIQVNERQITQQRKELQILKEDYARMIQHSYASKSLQNRLMFLFSSESFLQAYKRLQYLKQYTQFRKKQGVAIAKKTQLLQQLNSTLIEEKKKKQELITENREVQAALKKEQKNQESLVARLRKTERTLAAQIAKKEQQAREIDKEIDRLIREAIAASNKAAGKTGNSFELTPEAKLIAANFEANKGRLPWPVEKGIVIQGFGRQPHPVVKTTYIQSNGVTLATETGATVRAVFEGEVMSVVTYKGSNPSVLIRHGNYITVYKNLGKLHVKKGDKVKAKQEIGIAFTNQQSGKTQVQFSIFNNVKPLNPKGWVYQM